VGFYIRKSVKAGPFRFNLSKSGVGVSVGVPGFRIGTGPRGNYVFAGRDGFYYRASLGSPHRRQPTQQHCSPIAPPHSATVDEYRPSDVVMHDVTGSTALSLEPTGGGDVVAQLNAAAARMGFFWPVTIAGFVLGLLHPPYTLIIWVVLAPLSGWLFLHDQASRTVVLFYDVHDAPATWFDSLVSQWDWLTGSQKLLRVIQSGRAATTYQYKTHAGADSVIQSISAVASSKAPKHLSTNVAIPSIVARNAGLYFLPDRLLVKEGRRYSDIGYQHLHLSGYEKQIIQRPPVPGDALQVGQTWQYVNIKGGPDRRYANNPVLPIVLYGVLELTGPQGFSWQLEISRAKAASSIASVLSAVPANGHK
jgi:Protein of unknown function (DUF4236)